MARGSFYFKGLPWRNLKQPGPSFGCTWLDLCWATAADQTLSPFHPKCNKFRITSSRPANHWLAVVRDDAAQLLRWLGWACGLPTHLCPQEHPNGRRPIDDHEAGRRARVARPLSRHMATWLLGSRLVLAIVRLHVQTVGQVSCVWRGRSWVLPPPSPLPVA